MCRIGSIENQRQYTHTHKTYVFSLCGPNICWRQSQKPPTHIDLARWFCFRCLGLSLSISVVNYRLLDFMSVSYDFGVFPQNISAAIDDRLHFTLLYFSFFVSYTCTFSLSLYLFVIFCSAFFFLSLVSSLLLLLLLVLLRFYNLCIWFCVMLPSNSVLFCAVIFLLFLFFF